MNLKKQQCDYWEIVQLSTQGKRPSMEDASLFLYPFTASDSSLWLSVFDGHCGPRCSNFLLNTLPQEIRKETQSVHNLLPTEEQFCKVFADTDLQWLESAKHPRIEDGSTALCLALEGSDLIVANCGDSRAILCQAGQTQPITRDHKPTDEEEEQRIVLQGGTVIGGRLQGQLGVSRAFGNYEFKDSNILSSDPEIHQVTLTPDTELLVIGTDGLYEHFSNEEIISFIKNGLISSSATLENVIKELVLEAIDRGSEDNITIIAVKFEKGFKKLLKKRAKKHGKSTPSSPSGKSSPLRTSGKTPKQIDSPPPSPDMPSKIPSGIFKKGLKSTSKQPLGTISDKPEKSPNPPNLSAGTTSDKPEKSPTMQKKKRESKKIKVPYEEEKWNSIFSKHFKNDFFGRTPPVTISG